LPGACAARKDKKLRRRQALAMQLMPLTDHIVLQAIEQEAVTASGIVIPDSAKEKPQQGLVLAVGPGKMNDAGVVETADLKQGDRVLYQKYTGQEVTIDDEDYIVIRFGEVLARLEESSDKRSSRRKR
jgi:chaperonin GroES